MQIHHRSMQIQHFAHRVSWVRWVPLLGPLLLATLATLPRGWKVVAGASCAEVSVHHFCPWQVTPFQSDHGGFWFWWDPLGLVIVRRLPWARAEVQPHQGLWASSTRGPHFERHRPPIIARHPGHSLTCSHVFWRICLVYVSTRNVWRKWMPSCKNLRSDAHAAWPLYHTASTAAQVRLRSFRIRAPFIRESMAEKCQGPYEHFWTAKTEGGTQIYT